MQHIGDRPCGLDGVFDRQDDYARSGFVLAWCNLRYAFQATEGVDLDTACNAPPPVRRVHSDDFDRIQCYDESCFTVNRSPFLTEWLRADNATAVLTERDRAISGYAVARKCRAGYKIGPLFADDSPHARAMITALCQTLPASATIYLDVPEPNAHAMAIASDLNARETFGTARMYRGTPPAIPIERVFGITSFELG